MDDKEIVDLYWQRNEAAIDETAAKYGKFCHSIAYNILGNNEDAEESVNDTYLDAWNSIPPHRPSVLSTFLGKITRRVSIDRWRKHNAQKRGGGQIAVALEELEECISGGQSVEQEAEAKLLADVINSFVKSLSVTERSVFLCRYWYMDSIESIAKEFGFSQSKVKSMLYRTREKLRAKLVKEGLQ
ncbi:MAG: RNA polymerase sigma factor [Oscillospiraceae bacterium]